LPAPASCRPFSASCAAICTACLPAASGGCRPSCHPLVGLCIADHWPAAGCGAGGAVTGSNGGCVPLVASAAVTPPLGFASSTA
jgi:hypothetical protein